MFLPGNASRARQKEAQVARNNRAEVVKALSTGEVTRRDLFRWGLYTAGGFLAATHGFSPYARSAFAADAVGVPLSPTFGVLPFTQRMPRLRLQQPVPLTPVQKGRETELAFPSALGELNAKRLSYHTDFSAWKGTRFVNPLTGRGPIEGRAPGEYFAHQRWQEFLPQVGYVMSLGQLEAGQCFHPNMPDQGADACWTYCDGRFTNGQFAPPLMKVRYGEPLVVRVYNNLPVDRAQNGGFGRHEHTLHNHNAHNASASDGASNCYFFPGQFYDYHWGTTLARHDTINTAAVDPRASGPDGNGGLNHIPGDFRELQGTLWFHDHRFFFTAENVYKGMLGMVNYYSGPDRGNEELEDGVNLRLPSGTLLDSGNLDFDVNLVIADLALDTDGQAFYDIFNTDGFLGDLIHVNFAYKPFFEVLPRKYRFRVLAAGMSRFFKFALVDSGGRRVPVQVIANDGNLLPHPVTMSELDIQGVAERFDIVVDFSGFKVGQKLWLVNVLPMKDGRRPDDPLPLKEALNGKSGDPGVGRVLEFRLVNKVQSVDVPGVVHRANAPDRSRVPNTLTEQIPIVEPVRERVMEFGRSGDDDPRDPVTGACFPDCEGKESFPWTISVNGQKPHAFNANRISSLIPRPGEVEHWTLINGGGGWDHPIHLHFEEGVTISRGSNPMAPTEAFARKDVWRLLRGGTVKIQVQFGEYGGAYVNHCHNTAHEDASMILRYDVLTDPDNPNTSRTHVTVIPTPYPTPDGVQYVNPEILREGDPDNFPGFFTGRV